MRRAIVFAALAGLWALPVWALEASFISYEGKVQYKEAPASEWKDASKDAKLPQGAEILTGSNSNCRIRVGSADSALHIQQDSRAVLTSLSPVKVSLESGKLFALARNLGRGSSFEVRTPTAIAAARGTGWGQDAGSVKVFEDTVDVQGAGGGQEDVGEGKGIEIGEDGKLGEIFDLSDQDKGQWKDFVDGVPGGDGRSKDGEPAEEEDDPLDAFDAPETFMSDMLDSKDQTSQAKDEKDFSDLKAETKDNRQGEY